MTPAAARLLALPVLAIALQGCLAKTALDVATAPIKVASKAADWATTSQDEADRNRGREIRRREEKLAELESDYRELEEDCLAGDNDACREAVTVRNEIEATLPTVPVEPD